MKLDYLEIGVIVGIHGLQGELRVNPSCDSPAFFRQFDVLYYDAQGQQPVRVVSVREHKNLALLRLKGVDTAEQAQAMRNKRLFFKRADTSLEEGQYFIAELLGCEVYDANDGRLYGTLSDVTQPGANDVWHIKMKEDDCEVLIPVIDDVVKHVDVKTGRIEIIMLDGLLEV